MRLHLAAVGLLLVTGCTVGHQRTSPDSHQPAGIVTPAGQSDSRTPGSMPASTVPTTPVPTQSAIPVQASSSAPVPHTRQVVLRPVTDTGRPAPGYTLAAGPGEDQLSCGGAFPPESSEVAVDDGIAYCSPSAAYAVACWPGPTRNTALCFKDPWQRQVDRAGTLGRLTGMRAPRTPSPLGLELSDGTRCSVRDGGAWGVLDRHPELVGTYYCGDFVIWANRHSDGIDRSDPLWRVRLAPTSGHGTLRTVAVRTAYYVGTAATA